MKAIKGKVIVKMDVSQKERYALEGGPTIYIEKGYNFNKREDRPSRAEVIDGEGLPSGAEILIHHNATDPTYEMPYQHEYLTEEEVTKGFKMFSIPEDMCFAYKENGEWMPCENFVISLRIFKPYKGSLVGIDHEKVKNRMYIVKGVYKEMNLPVLNKKECKFDPADAVELSGKVCVTLDNCDYQIIWHNTDDREESLIRTRHREIQAIDHNMLEQIKNGELLIGITADTAKRLNET